MFNGAIVYQTLLTGKSILLNPILNSLTLNEYYWFDKRDINGNLFYNFSSYYKILSQLIIFSLLILIIIGTIKTKNRNNIKEIGKKYILFFLILFLFSIFFTKGTAEPFGFFYRFLLINFKIFGIYRASDVIFPFITVFTLSFFITYFLILFNNNKSKIFKLVKFAYLPTLLILCGLPFIFGQIFDAKSFIKIPKYWQDIAIYLDKQPDSGRVLILPKNFSPFDTYKWGYNGGWLGNRLINKTFIGYTLGYGSTVQEKKYFKEINVLYDLLESNNYSKFLKLLKIYNISYILIRNDFDIYNNSKNSVDYGTNYNFYKNGSANKIINDNLKNKKIFGELVLYNTNINNNLINSDNKSVSFKKINPTKYLVSIKNAKKDYELDFLESFENNWRLYLNSKILTNSIAKHNIKYNYANSWNIDINKLCNNNSACVKNPDGNGYNFELVLEFWPQKLYYVGLFIDGTALIGCLSYLVWSWVRGKKEKEEEGTIRKLGLRRHTS
jgi:hypothetical protein